MNCCFDLGKEVRSGQWHSKIPLFGFTRAAVTPFFGTICGRCSIKLLPLKSVIPGLSGLGQIGLDVAAYNIAHYAKLHKLYP